MITPGNTPLSTWNAIYRGESATLDPSCHDKIQASADAVEAILARHEPVYGINTGFGKLASVRIGDEDLETLQRNIVLSHAAGVGAPMPAPVVRLMIALKLASLAQGHSGVRPATIAMLQDMLDRGITPIIPSQGSVGASGDLAPLAHLAAAMIGTGDVLVDGVVRPARDVLAPLTLGPKEGLALLNGTQSMTALGLVTTLRARRIFAHDHASARRNGKPRRLRRRESGCGVRRWIRIARVWIHRSGRNTGLGNHRAVVARFEDRRVDIGSIGDERAWIFTGDVDDRRRGREVGDVVNLNAIQL